MGHPVNTDRAHRLGDTTTVPSRRISYYDLVLAGGGHAHLPVLELLARYPVSGLRCCLISTDTQTVYSGLLPGWMSGAVGENETKIDVAALAVKAGIKFIRDEVSGLDADRKCLDLASGKLIGFNKLSLATGGESDLTYLSQMGNKVLLTKPVNHFVRGWKQVHANLQSLETASIAIVGGGAAGCELALATRSALAKPLDITLFTGNDGPLPSFSGRARAMITQKLLAANVRIVRNLVMTSADGILQESGTALNFDAVIAATGNLPPAWIRNSGLAVSEQGFVLIDSKMRSISHNDIFAAGDVSLRRDGKGARSGVHAVKSGPILAQNLRAQFEKAPLVEYNPRKRSLYILATGNRQAILTWGFLTAAGRLPWLIKSQIDYGFIRKYQRLAK